MTLGGFPCGMCIDFQCLDLDQFEVSLICFCQQDSLQVWQTAGTVTAHMLHLLPHVPLNTKLLLEAHRHLFLIVPCDLM